MIKTTMYKIDGKTDYVVESDKDTGKQVKKTNYQDDGK
ncbi:DUF2963 domain-containing protein, partial [Candidatus Phytoplasma phoenicium]